MSLHPHVITPVPAETARVARAAFPKGHPYLTFRDALGTIFQDEDFTALFPAWGPPGLPPWRLALVTIMQFRENLADRQAAEAVRARIDWKYLKVARKLRRSPCEPHQTWFSSHQAAARACRSSSL
jgi:transposase